MALKEIDGKPIVNAKRPLTVHVTPRDIKGADPKNPADCAFARACRREYHAREVRAHLGCVYVRANEGNWVRYKTPQALRTEIVAFDRGGRFVEGEFTLGKPRQDRPTGKRQGGAPKYKQARSNPRSVRRVKMHALADVREGPA